MIVFLHVPLSYFNEITLPLCSEPHLLHVEELQKYVNSLSSTRS